MKDAGKQGRSVGEWGQGVMSPSPLPNRFLGVQSIIWPVQKDQVKSIYMKKNMSIYKRTAVQKFDFSSEINDEL